MFRSSPTPPPWTQPDWIEQSGAWATTELARLGRRVTGPIESIHARIWSTVLRIPTDAGNVFLKACGPAGFHEPRLLQFLAESFPGRTPRVIAINEHHKWVILQDAGGERLREVLARDRNLRHWRAILPLYAQLQVDLIDHVKDLLSLGVPDDRPGNLPAQFQSLLDHVELLYLDQPGGLRSSDHARLCELLPRVRQVCDGDLLACGIPQTLHHGAQ